jgi:murein DD-endopeptidase MepM/ murein hydrolase activator NlpD
VRTRDGVADNVPGSKPPVDVTRRTVPGIYVIVDIGGGHFAAYAHPQPGSLQVHVGDHVRRGGVLGRLVNSGNPDLPHLHFHVADGPLFLGADGRPYHFRSFASEGTLTNPDDVICEDGGAAIISPTLAGPHRQQLPPDLQVVEFQRR